MRLWQFLRRSRRRPNKTVPRYRRVASISGRSGAPRRGAPDWQALSLFGIAAIGGQLVAVGIADIAGISMRPETARADRALVLAAHRQRGLVELGDRGAAWRGEADRPAIGRAGGFAVGRGQHHEFLGLRAPA